MSIQIQNYPIFQSIKNDKPKKNHILKNTIDEDREFLKELSILNAISGKIDGLQADNNPDIYWFHVQSLHPLIDLYGENSTQVKEAKKLLNEAINHLNGAFKAAYKGRVLVSIVASDAIHTRRTRSILSVEDDVRVFFLNKLRRFHVSFFR